MNNVVNDVVLSPSGRFNFVTKRLKFIFIHTVANHLFWPLDNIAFTAKPWYTTWRKWYFGHRGVGPGQCQAAKHKFWFHKSSIYRPRSWEIEQTWFLSWFSNLLNWTKSSNLNDLVSSEIIREWHSMIIRSLCRDHAESLLTILWPMGCWSSQ